MKAFKFTGFGNYSFCHGWDNGLSCNLKEEVDFSLAIEGLGSVFCGEVVETLINEYGGSRNAEGFVFASSRELAEKALKDYENSFEVIEYQQD